MRAGQLGQPALGEIDGRQLDATRIEARIDRRGPHERAREQAGADHEDHAARDLRADERAAQTQTARDLLLAAKRRQVVVFPMPGSPASSRTPPRPATVLSKAA